MINFNNLSIRKKIIGIILLTTSAILIISSGIVISNKIITSKKELIERSLAEARFIGEYCIVYLSFNDSDGAEKILKNVESIPTILAVRIYDENDNLFSEFKRSGEEIFPIELKTEVFSEFSKDHLHIFHPILFENKYYGTVFLKVSTSELFQNIYNFVILMIILILVLATLSYFLAIKLQNIISGPILNLANATMKISKGADYSLRVTKQGEDEIGVLFDGFNNMLKQIEIREEERNQALQSLKDSEKQLKYAQLSAGAGLWDWDMKTNNIKWSPELFFLFGFDSELKDTSFETWDKCMHPDDKKSAYEKLNISIKDHIQLNNEYRVVHPNGKIIWINAIGNTSYDDEGNPVRNAGICIDITERKQAEEALRESEEKYRALAENSVDSIFMIDQDFKVIYVNNAGASQFKSSKDKIIGKSVEDLFTPENSVKQMASLKKVICDKQIIQSEEIIRFPDGEIWLEIKLIPIFDEEKNVKYVYGISSDITKRKQAEIMLRDEKERIRTILDLVGDPIFVKNNDHRITFANHAFYEMFGMDEKSVIGNTLVEAVPEDERHHFLKVDRAVLDTGIDDIHEEELTVGDFTRTIITRKSRFINESGIRFLVGSIHDITERKQAEEKIHNLNDTLEKRVIERTEELQTANEELEAFSYSVSHDLRAPIRAIDGFTRILAEEYRSVFDDEGKRLLDVVLKNTQNMGQLIDDLLSFSRMSRKKVESSLVQMEQLVKEVAKELKDSNKNRKLEIKIKQLSNIKGDRALLQQVIANLLSNAIKFTEPNDEAVIEIGNLKKNHQNIYFVKDNGVGFEMKYVHKIFDVFQRLHSAKDFEGTGVGLAIVQKIIQRHGGKIWAEAKVNEGATFYFSLPN